MALQDFKTNSKKVQITIPYSDAKHAHCEVAPHFVTCIVGVFISSTPVKWHSKMQLTAETSTYTQPISSIPALGKSRAIGERSFPFWLLILCFNGPADIHTIWQVFAIDIQTLYWRCLLQFVHKIVSFGALKQA
jgi:hypothetical protein